MTHPVLHGFLPASCPKRYASQRKRVQKLFKILLGTWVFLGKPIGGMEQAAPSGTVYFLKNEITGSLKHFWLMPLNPRGKMLPQAVTDNDLYELMANTQSLKPLDLHSQAKTATPPKGYDPRRREDFLISCNQDADLSIRGQSILSLALKPNLTKLDLSRCHLEDAEVQAFRGCKSLGSLTDLTLSHNSISDRGAESLVFLTALTSLDLSYNTIGHLGVHSLASHNTLQFLNLSSNPIGDQGADALSNNWGLTSLTLRSCPLSNAGIISLARHPALKILDLSVNQFKEDGMGIKALSGNTILTALNLSQSNIDDAAAEILSQNRTLSCLSLWRTKVTSGGVNFLAHHPGLTKLGLPATPLSLQNLQDLSGNTLLAGLDICFNHLGDMGVQFLASNPSLKILILAGNGISAKGVKYLSENNLTELDLSCNPVGDQGAGLLANIPTLKKLSLWGSEITDAGAILLANSSSITYLDLAYNQIGDQGAIALGSNANLTFLDLRGNKQIGEAGFLALANNTALRTLSLIGNEMSEEAKSALTRNKGLVALWLDDDDEDHERASIYQTSLLKTFPHSGGRPRYELASKYNDGSRPFYLWSYRQGKLAGIKVNTRISDAFLYDLLGNVSLFPVIDLAKCPHITSEARKSMSVFLDTGFLPDAQGPNPEGNLLETLNRPVPRRRQKISPSGPPLVRLMPEKSSHGSPEPAGSAVSKKQAREWQLQRQSFVTNAIPEAAMTLQRLAADAANMRKMKSSSGQIEETVYDFLSHIDLETHPHKVEIFETVYHSFRDCLKNIRKVHRPDKGVMSAMDTMVSPLAKFVHPSWYRDRLLLTMIKGKADTATIRYLLEEMGMDATILDDEGQGVLHAAVMADLPLSALQILVKAGASLELVDETRLSALDIAMERGNRQAFQDLIQLGVTQARPTLAIKFYNRYVRQEDTGEALCRSFSTLMEKCSDIDWRVGLSHLLPEALPHRHDSLSSLENPGPSSPGQSHQRLPLPKNMMQHRDSPPKKHGTLRFKGMLGGKSTSQLKLRQAEGIVVGPFDKGLRVSTATLGSRWIASDIHQQIFDTEGRFKAQNPTSIHPVGYGRILPQSTAFKAHGLYFKVYPEFPGIEEAVGWLTREILGYGAPYTEVIKLEKYPVLLSREVQGKTLETVLNSQGNQELNRLDPESISGLILLAILTNPEDGEPDNYVMEPHPLRPDQYRLVAINNGRSFVPAIASAQGTNKTAVQVKTILYCLDQMNDPVHPDSRQKILSLAPRELMRQWLRFVKHQNNSYSALFTPEEQEKFLSERESFMGVPFQPGAVAHLYDKLVQMQDIMASGDTAMTHMELLTKLDPRLAARYKPVFEAPQPVIDRFRQVHGSFYQPEKSGRFKTLTTTAHLLQAMNIPSSGNIFQLMQEGKGYSVVQALEELEKIGQEIDCKNMSELAIKTGILDLLSALALETSRSAFLDQLNFEKLHPSQQDSILQFLEGKPLRELIIKSCMRLKDIHLTRQLTIEYLRKADLRGCQEITSKGIVHLSEVSKNLEELNLSGITTLKTLIPGKKGQLLDFPSLKSLDLQGCTQLAAASFKAPALKELTIDDCPRLTDEILDSVNDHGYSACFQSLSARNCPVGETGYWAEANLYFTRKLQKALGNDQAKIRKLFTTIKAADTQGSSLDLSKKLKSIAPSGAAWAIDSGIWRALPGLTSLTLKGNRLNATAATALTAKTSLTALDLSKNQLGDEGAAILAGAGLSNLTRLDLSDNQTGNKGAEALAHSTSLKSLNLEQNNIGDEGAIALASSNTLTSLYLSGNQIGNAGARALSANPILTELRLSDNLMGEEGKRFLQTSRNPHIRSSF